MKDPSFVLRKAYKQAIASSGVVLNVFDGQSDSTEGNYIILNVQEVSFQGTKDTDTPKAKVSIDIVTRFQNNRGSSKVSDDIANLILNYCTPSAGVLNVSIDNFNISTFEVSIRTIEGQFGSERIIRKIITIDHELYEN